MEHQTAGGRALLARGRVRVLACAAAAGSLLAAPVAMAQDVPADFGDITLPVDIASVASAVFAVGGTVLVAALGLVIGFKLIRKAARRMAGGV